MERQRFGVPPHLVSCHNGEKSAATPWKAIAPPPPSRKCCRKAIGKGLDHSGMLANAPVLKPHIAGTSGITAPGRWESSRLYSVE